MRKKLIFAGSLLILACLVWTYGQTKRTSSYELTGLSVTVASAKSSYILGESVLLNFEVSNDSDSDVYLGGAKLNTGYLTIFIASDDNKFKRYRAVGTGKKISPTLLKKGERIKSSNKILWNASLAENSANPKEFEETDILSYYAFPKAGKHLIKAVLHGYGEQASMRIESEPIEITLEEPTGDDLDSWKIIKDRQDIGYFIQEGYFRASKSEEKEKVLRDIEEIILQYPNSIISKQIEQSLDKFRANKEKRRVILESKQKP